MLCYMYRLVLAICTKTERHRYIFNCTFVYICRMDTDLKKEYPQGNLVMLYMGIKGYISFFCNPVRTGFCLQLHM